MILPLVEKRQTCLANGDHYPRRICRAENIFWPPIGHREVETPSLQESLEIEAKLGEELISRLPHELKSRNIGKFIAITYDNKILAICDSLEILNEKLRHEKPRQNYYMAKIGHDSIARIE